MPARSAGTVPAIPHPCTPHDRARSRVHSEERHPRIRVRDLACGLHSCHSAGFSDASSAIAVFSNVATPATISSAFTASTPMGERPTSGYTSCARAVSAVSYTHLRAHETVLDLVCRLLLEKKKKNRTQ